MAEEKRKDEKKEKAGKNIDPATTGSQIGMGKRRSWRQLR